MSFPRGKYLKTLGETTSFPWVKLQGSGVGYCCKSESSGCIVAAYSLIWFTVHLTWDIIYVFSYNYMTVVFPIQHQFMILHHSQKYITKDLPIKFRTYTNKQLISPLKWCTVFILCAGTRFLNMFCVFGFQDSGLHYDCRLTSTTCLHGLETRSRNDSPNPALGNVSVRLYNIFSRKRSSYIRNSHCLIFCSVGWICISM